METPRQGVSTYDEAIIDGQYKTDRPYNSSTGNLAIRAGVNTTYGGSEESKYN
jgi:hypothetical protein